MATDDGGALPLVPAPAPGQVYLLAWRRVYDRLVTMLRQAYAQVEDLSNRARAPHHRAPVPAERPPRA